MDADPEQQPSALCVHEHHPWDAMELHQLHLHMENK